MKLRTHPRHWLDFTLWPLLRLFWEPFSKKRSHFWHWQPFDRSAPENFRERVDRDGCARERAGLLANLFQTNFGWRSVAILCPAVRNGNAYQLGFISREGNAHKRELCAIVLDGPCAALVGPHEVEFFAVAYPGGEPIPLELVRRTVKARLPEDIPLL